MTDASGCLPLSVPPSKNAVAISPFVFLGFLCWSRIGASQEPEPKAENHSPSGWMSEWSCSMPLCRNGKGRVVPGLQKENFKVAKDGIPQEILLFQREDIPVTVGIILDTSGSMRNKRAEVVAAALAFARSCNPQDEMFVVGFNDDVVMALPPDKPFTSDLKDLRQAFPD